MSLNFLLVITCDGYDISIFIGMEFFREKCIICHGFWIFLSRKFSVTKSRIYSKALGSWSSYTGHHLLRSLRRKKIKAGRFALFYSPIPFRLFCQEEIQTSSTGCHVLKSAITNILVRSTPLSSTSTWFAQSKMRRSKEAKCVTVPLLDAQHKAVLGWTPNHRERDTHLEIIFSTHALVGFQDASIVGHVRCYL